MKELIKKYLVLIFGASLPILFVAAIYGYQLIAERLVSDPQYDLLLANKSIDLSYGLKEAPLSLNLDKPDTIQLEKIVDDRSGYSSPVVLELYMYHTKTGKLTKVSLPEILAKDSHHIKIIEELKQYSLSTDKLSPDGYKALRFSRLFLDNKNPQLIVAKSGRKITLTTNDLNLYPAGWLLPK